MSSKKIMEKAMKRLVFDLDGTICNAINGDYANAMPISGVIDKIKAYKKLGFEISIYTSRNMKTYNNSIGKISAFTLPIILKWLADHDVPYDEVTIGKPWCGVQGFYIDDRAIRPNEFINYDYTEILKLVTK